MSSNVWQYGVTTVPQRLDDGLTDRTLASLKYAGFDGPRLFIDGAEKFRPNWPCLPATFRQPRIGIMGNWFLSLSELYARNPNANKYAIFQDDLVTCKNLRTYLDICEWPENGYLNLMTFRDNEVIIHDKPIGWCEASWINNGKGQSGRSAVALVFPREAVMLLLSSQCMVEWFRDAFVGHRKVDGAVVRAMNAIGWKEYVHKPSLVQHTGDVSTIRNSQHPKAKTFPGTEYDALNFLKTESLRCLATT
jgi:hypothetical protein